jgi:hypothetical protein
MSSIAEVAPHRLPKSYSVPALGLLLLKVPRAGDASHAAIRLAASSGESAAYKKLLLGHYALVDSTTFVHEWGHILQNVYYPYLYLRSVRESRLIDSLLADIQSDASQKLPASFNVTDEVNECFHLDRSNFRFTIADTGEVSLQPPTGTRRHRFDICEVDLIEEANSIFEFRVDSGEAGTGEKYHEWLKVGPKYTRVFRFLSRVFGREGAFNTLQPLVAASYHTTYPVTSFAMLVEYARKNLDAEESSPAWLENDLIEAIRNTLSNEGEIVKLKQLPTDDSHSYIDDRSMATYLAESEHHPLHRLASRVWEQSSLLNRDWLYEPHHHIRDKGHRVREEVKDLEPPFSWLVYDSTEVNLGSSMMLLSPLYRDKRPPQSVDPDGNTGYPEYVEMLHVDALWHRDCFRAVRQEDASFVIIRNVNIMAPASAMGT